MSWKLVWTAAEVDDILDSIARTTRLPRDEIDAVLERAHPHHLRDELLERQWVGRLAWASSELLENVSFRAARFCLADPLWINLHGTISDIWDTYNRRSKWPTWSKNTPDPLEKTRREAFAAFWTQLNAFRSSFTEDERSAISLMRQVRCHPYQREWAPRIAGGQIVDRVKSRALDTKPTTTKAWAAFDAFLASYGSDEKAVINIAHRIHRPTADLVAALDAYQMASRRVAQRDMDSRDARTTAP